MKNLFLIAIATLLFASCSPYQKVLNGDDVGAKYAMADSLYKVKKYAKAVRLMEQIVPAYRGKPQAQKLMYLYSNSYFELGDYFLSGYQFERFAISYPTSDSVEVAAYKSAKSYYELSPRYSLDQKETYTALEKLQAFVNNYPNSDKRTEANSLVAELRKKLDKKDFETASQYFKISDYKAAINAYDNFITNHPGSEYREEAFYGRFDSAYKLAINSFPSLVQERLITAVDHYNSYIKYYAEGEESAEAAKIKADIDKRLTAYDNPS